MPQINETGDYHAKGKHPEPEWQISCVFSFVKINTTTEHETKRNVDLEYRKYFNKSLRGTCNSKMCKRYSSDW